MTTEGQDEGPVTDWSQEIDRLQRQIFDILAFASERRQAGLLTRQEEVEVSAAFNKIVVHDGGLPVLQNNAISAALGRQGVHAMLQTLRDFRPEWEADIAKLDPPGRKR
jgi:ATP-dependent helicase YprA (DUF1998 family)